MQQAVSLSISIDQLEILVDSCCWFLLLSIANNKRLTFTSDWLAMGGGGGCRGNISAISIVFWFSYRKLLYGICSDYLCLLLNCFIPFSVMLLNKYGTKLSVLNFNFSLC